MHAHSFRSVAILLIAAAATAAHAGISHDTVPVPGGFVQTGAYTNTTGATTSSPGEDITFFYGSGPDFHEQAYSGASSAHASAARTVATISNSATGDTGMGYAYLAAANASPDNTPFALGVANGGWKETFTISDPALTGQQGYMVFQIHVKGTMHTTGLTGLAMLQTTGFRNEIEIPQNPYFDRGSSDSISTDRQRAQWSIASFGTPENRAVDSYVTMAVSFFFGHPFDLGVYAEARAGQRSQGGGGGSSTAGIDFSGDGITWNGIIAIRSASGPITGYTITTGSGFDWSGPVGGCSADLSGDGLVDFSDYLEFLNLFDAQDPRVDFNQDGVVDFSDYLEFLNLFDAGC